VRDFTTLVARSWRAAAFALFLAVSWFSSAAAELAGALAIDEVTLQRMERAAAQYRDLAATAPWPYIEEGPTLRPGKTDPRLPAVRRLLLLTGDLTQEDSGAPDAYTPALADAVRAFQRRHGLSADAAIGRRTQAALAVHASDRAHALSLNLERLRELNRRLPPSVIVVNVPAFALTILSSGRPEWHTRVIVGRPSWPTPTFDSAITQVELNPYWNVPSSIARRELAPIIARDLGYLARHDMKVLPLSANAPAIDPASVNWRRFGASGFRLRQDPGPENPLGQVKFQIPSAFDVYLHDTPGKSSFERDMRAISHGCIRVEHAMELAGRLLTAEPDWSAERLASEVTTGRNIKIALTRPTPVAIVYVTAWVDPDGTVQFRHDLYAKDAGPGADARPESCGAPSLG
jgi:murein L,D-transpeptidase YcbB/YkuD